MISAFSVWKDHGTTITTSPSLIHVLFFIFPGMRVSLTTPSMHLTRSLLAPNRLSTVPSTSPAFFCGRRTLVNSSGCWLLLSRLFSITPHHLYHYSLALYVKVTDNILYKIKKLIQLSDTYFRNQFNEVTIKLCLKSPFSELRELHGT